MDVKGIGGNTNWMNIFRGYRGNFVICCSRQLHTVCTSDSKEVGFIDRFSPNTIGCIFWAGSL